MDQICPRCRSEHLIRDLRLADESPAFGSERSKDHLVEFDSSPNALIFKDTMSVRVRAVVCGNCGHVELVAEDPQGLWAMYQEATHPRQS